MPDIALHIILGLFGFCGFASAVILLADRRRLQERLRAAEQGVAMNTNEHIPGITHPKDFVLPRLLPLGHHNLPFTNSEDIEEYLKFFRRLRCEEHEGCARTPTDEEFMAMPRRNVLGSNKE